MIGDEMATTNAIEVHWSEIFNSIRGLKADTQNRLRIRREVIPVLFVPGIMGSRLSLAKGEDANEKAWDPDDPLFMLANFGFFTVTAAKRKAILVGDKFDPDYLKVDNDNPKHNKKFASSTDSTRARRGWGGIFWGSYGRFLKELQSQQWPEPIGHCFEFPVHAFGYNWSASCDDNGQKLGEYIDQTIDLYKNGLKDETGEKLPRLCEQVILVTHSMGGLVARSACLRHRAERNVLGVIHGVQPTTGSPAAYWRMKAGFERPRFSVDGDSWWRFFNPLKLVDAVGRKVVGNITAATLGSNGEEVTSLLANMPGGLQLLPTTRYVDNNGRREWLGYQQQDGTMLALPEADPYAEIYLEETKPWRMVNPDWIDPRPTEAATTINPMNLPWREYKINLTEAKSFHAALEESEKQAHNDTVQFYSTGLDSPDHVSYTRRPFQSCPASDPWGNVELVRQFTNKGEFRGYVDDKDKPLPTSDGAAAIIALAMPDGSGDGTVPDSSGRALPLDQDRTVAIGETGSSWYESRFDRGHEGIFQTNSAKQLVLRSIVNLALKRIEKVCVEKGYQNYPGKC